MKNLDIMEKLFLKELMERLITQEQSNKVNTSPKHSTHIYIYIHTHTYIYILLIYIYVCSVYMYVKYEVTYTLYLFIIVVVLGIQSCPTLDHPRDCTLPGSSVHGFSQPRIV